MFKITSSIAVMVLAGAGAANAAGPTPTPVEPVVAAPMVSPLLDKDTLTPIYEGMYANAN